MNPSVANVRAIRPMRILLVTDDGRYAGEVADAASLRGVDLVAASIADDLDAAFTLHAPNVVVLDADRTLARTSRKATVFAALHPRIATVVVASRAPAHAGSALVVEKRRPAARLLPALEEAYLGVPAPVEARSGTGE